MLHVQSNLKSDPRIGVLYLSIFVGNYSTTSVETAQVTVYGIFILIELYSTPSLHQECQMHQDGLL